MLIDNLRLRGREGLWQLRVADGRIAALVPMEQAADDAGERLDGAGGLAVPPFIEPHIHLDTTQTAGQPEWNRSGTLFEGIERWAQRKALLSHEDVKQRAWQTLKWQIANGVQHVRSHVDVSDPTLTALKAMLEVRGEVAPWVDLQIVAFPQEGILSYPNGLELLEESLRLGADVVGAIPHFEFTRELGVESLHKAIDLAKRYDVLVVHDLAYADITFDGWKAPSIMQVPGAKDIAVEFFTLSKSYNMAGWRIGFMVGNPELVSALARIKSYHDYGTFTPLQVAAIAALEGDQQCVRDIARQYQQRRDVLVKGLREAGWMVENPKASMYVWAKIPEPYAHLGSLEFAKKLLQDAKVSVSPGIGFGDYGDDHVRFALIENRDRLRQAVRGIKSMFRADGLLSPQKKVDSLAE